MLRICSSKCTDIFLSAKRSESLKSCYDFTEKDFKKVVKHIPTSWLSLFAAIKRLIENLDEIKSYFIGINEEECPQIIYEFVLEESDERLTLSEIYLHFTYEYIKVFSDTILELEKKSTNATQVYNIMLTLRGKLKNRLNLKFYGIDINEK